jgi:hypothetical protein
MKPDLTGFWELNLAKSKLIGPQPARVLLKLNHHDPELIDAMISEYPDGHSVLDVFEVTTTGEECVNTICGVRLISSAVWQGDELLIESSAQVGERKLHFRDFWSLAEGGATLRMEHRDDDLAGQLAIFERAAEAELEFDDV